jgi:hypothetical protein
LAIEGFFWIWLNFRAQIRTKMSDWFRPLDLYLKKIIAPLPGRISYNYKFISDEPDAIVEKIIYVVGERPHYWMLLFKCPCGCGEAIRLNTLRTASPSWKFHIRWRRISVYPSVWRKVGCKSHFHVRKGKVRWSYI